MIIAALVLAAGVSQVDYRFDQVKRNVALNDVQVAPGHHAQSGDKVQTGWFSYALIASDHYRAKFEIFSSTDVQLAGGTPGVILSVERGRIHAMFDKITGSEPRIVQTPGALLAVRGTQYNVEVDAAGKTIVDVFEGTVEIRSPLRTEPFLVHAGETSSFSRRDPPPDHPIKTPDDRRQDAPGRRDGAPPDPHGSHDAPGAHPGDPGAHGAPPPPPQPANRPPPPPDGPRGPH